MIILSNKQQKYSSRALSVFEDYERAALKKTQAEIELRRQERVAAELIAREEMMDAAGW